MDEKIVKGINFASFELKEKIISTIYEYNLPYVNVRQILGEVYNDVLNGEKIAIKKEKEDYENKIKEQKNENS